MKGALLVTSQTKTGYSGITVMFKSLRELDEGSIEYSQQREAIIAGCLPLADHIARRFDSRGEGYEDLVQVARIGLIHAVNRYDPEFGSEFLAFAVPTMMGEVRRYFRDNGWSVKVPRRMKDLQPQINRARDQLFQEIRRSPTPSEIADRLGIDRDEVVQCKIAAGAYSTVSYDAPARGTDDTDNRTVGDSFGAADASLDKVIDVETVRPLVAALPTRQQTVLMLRFFDNMTQSQIAERLGVSQMHVSRLLSRSLATLREQAENSPTPVALPTRPKRRSRRKMQSENAIQERSA